MISRDKKFSNQFSIHYLITPNGLTDKTMLVIGQFKSKAQDKVHKKIHILSTTGLQVQKMSPILNTSGLMRGSGLQRLHQAARSPVTRTSVALW